MRRSLIFITALLFLCALCVAIYFLPPVYQRLSWRIANIRTQVYYLINPPDQVALAPAQQVQDSVSATLQAMSLPTATQPLPLPSPTAPLLDTPAPTVRPSATPSPTPTATPLPFQVALTGFHFEWQTFNNCGPANTAMLLSYWGWQGDQRVARSALRPHEDDANVMPQEIAAYAAQNGLRAYIRVGGNAFQLKKLLAAGFPVMVELGHQPSDDWWMGHYMVISGYNNLQGVFITQDSLIQADLPLPVVEVEQRWWRDFNRLYIVFAPPEREVELLALLGPDADQEANLRRALAETEAEIPGLTGRDLFFALYNQGADFYALGQPTDAANAFDLAFAVYAGIDEKDRPWRVLWYRQDAYAAYYASDRHQSVIDLARATLSMLSKRGLEESHYWRGMSYAALGDVEKARFDLDLAVRLRTTYTEAIDALNSLP